jgi:hypothetical protein
MVRPIEGFMSEDGKFFETEALCELYEAKLAVTTLVRDKLNEAGMSLTSTGLEYFSNLISEWVVNNIDTFTRYAKVDPQPLLNFKNDIRAEEVKTELEQNDPGPDPAPELEPAT